MKKNRIRFIFIGVFVFFIASLGHNTIKWLEKSSNKEDTKKNEKIGQELKPDIYPNKSSAFDIEYSNRHFKYPLNEIQDQINIKDSTYFVEPVDEIKEQPLMFSQEIQLIKDSTKISYYSFVPEKLNSECIQDKLSIYNPAIDIKAKSGILIDVDTKEIKYYKEPLEIVFPASTSKLLTALVALDYCELNEEVKLGSEVKMIASDSTKAFLYPNQILTVEMLLEGMLLPSGNDAAYALAKHVGSKILNNEDATNEEAVLAFVLEMNKKASELGVVCSYFKTPDGYDAIGQYTTAYDMALIGVAALNNKIIRDICNKSISVVRFISGEQVTWRNTNGLIHKDSPRYYPYAIGLKTGTSTMAGRCLISAATKNGKTYLSVVMASSQESRFSDATKMFKYIID